MPACSTCSADDREHLENLGNQALRGAISWREAARQGGLTHANGLQNHMDRHYVSEVEVLEAQVTESLEGLIAQARLDILQEAAGAQPDAKAALLVVVHNLDGLLGTKPSQGSLLAALKAVHEIQGMKTENQLLLAFAARKFKQPGIAPGQERVLPRG